MRVGVICEGPTDFIAIREFLASCAERCGAEVEFLSILPDMDETRKNGGWSLLLVWLHENGPDARTTRYFGGGLFDEGLSSKKCDAIIIQLDADILGDEAFQRFALERYGFTIENPEVPADRGREVIRVLDAAARTQELTEADRSRHLLAPAVEATETWCLAAFERREDNPEELREARLTQEFMSALERSEGRVPEDEYASPDKNVVRREKFCKRHREGSRRIRASCTHFDVVAQAIIDRARA